MRGPSRTRIDHMASGHNPHSGSVPPLTRRLDRAPNPIGGWAVGFEE